MQAGAGAEMGEAHHKWLNQMIKDNIQSRMENNVSR